MVELFELDNPKKDPVNIDCDLRRAKVQGAKESSDEVWEGEAYPLNTNPNQVKNRFGVTGLDFILFTHGYQL